MSPEQQTINEGNKLIAEVIMGWHTECSEPLTWYEKKDCANYLVYSQHYDQFKQLPFHKDWNWLMKAVEKAEKDHSDLLFEITGNSCHFYDVTKFDDTQTDPLYMSPKETTKIQATWQAVVEVAKYISKNKL